MKKHMRLLTITVLILTFLTACGKSLKVDENTVYVQKNGKVVGATVENFDKDYYDAGELEAYINKRVDSYVEDHGKKSVKVDRYSVEESVARLNIRYADYMDYADFNEVELFAGTIPQAMAEGYDFDDEFYTVENGVIGETVGKDTVTENDKYKVVILSEKINVKVDGAVQYVSAAYTEMVSKDTVAIRLPEDAVDGEELAITYIIYK